MPLVCQRASRARAPGLLTERQRSRDGPDPRRLRAVRDWVVTLFAPTWTASTRDIDTSPRCAPHRGDRVEVDGRRAPAPGAGRPARSPARPRVGRCGMRGSPHPVAPVSSPTRARSSSRSRRSAATAATTASSSTPPASCCKLHKPVVHVRRNRCSRSCARVRRSAARRRCSRSATGPRSAGPRPARGSTSTASRRPSTTSATIARLITAETGPARARSTPG